MNRNVKEEEQEKLIIQLTKLNANNNWMINQYLKKCARYQKHPHKYSIDSTSNCLYHSQIPTPISANSIAVKYPQQLLHSHSQSTSFINTENQTTSQFTKSENYSVEKSANQHPIDTSDHVRESQAQFSENTKSYDVSIFDNKQKSSIDTKQKQASNIELKTHKMKPVKSAQKGNQMNRKMIRNAVKRNEKCSKSLNKLNVENKRREKCQKPIQGLDREEIKLGIVKLKSSEQNISENGNAPSVLSYYKKFVQFIKHKQTNPNSGDPIVKENKTLQLMNKYKKLKESKHKNSIAYHLDNYDLEQSRNSKALLNLQNIKFKSEQQQSTSSTEHSHGALKTSIKYPRPKVYHRSKQSNQQFLDENIRNSIKKEQEVTKSSKNIVPIHGYHSTRQKYIHGVFQSDESLKKTKVGLKRNAVLPKIYERKAKLSSDSRPLPGCASTLLKNHKDKYSSDEVLIDGKNIKMEVIGIEQAKQGLIQKNYSGVFRDQQGYKMRGQKQRI